MIPIDYSFLLNLLPPALILSVLAYLTRFFGKIIADQHPVVDDRSWHIELSGAVFMIGLSSGIIGVAQAINVPISFDHWWIHAELFVAVSLLYAWLTLSNSVTSRKFYAIYQEKVTTYTGFRKDFHQVLLKSNKYFSVGIISIALFYIATLEYFSGNVVWTAIVWTIIFQTLIQLVFNFSFKQLNEVVPVDIYFVDEAKETLRGVMILKMNEDNLRVRSGDKILILNKDIVAKIEMTIPQNRR